MEKTTNKTLAIVLFVILALGLVIYFAGSDKDSVANQTNTENTNGDIQANNGTTPVDGGNGDGSSNQVDSVVLRPTETGNSVTVAQATLTKPGYVVIYRANSNSETAVLGNSELLLPGTYNDLSIQLDSIISLNQNVVAVLHEDDGDGEFEFPESDFYLGGMIVSDVDVVDVDAEDEDTVLQAQVDAFLEKNMEDSN